MSKGNKGLWDSTRKLLLLAAMAITIALPLHAQTLSGGSLDLTNRAQLSSGSISFYGGSITLGQPGSSMLTYVGPIGIVKEGSGTLILSGSNTNTYSGATTVSGGSLEVNPPAPINPGGTLQFDPSGTLTYSGYVPYTGEIVSVPLLPVSTTTDEPVTTTSAPPSTLTFSVVPEPTSIGLLVTGAVFMSLSRMRRKHS